MQAQHAYIGTELNPVAQSREQNAMELQDAVSRYLPALYRRAYRYVGDHHDAEDAVQDALLSAYKHLDQFKATAKMTTWLTTIVTNSALTQLRKRPRHPHVSLDDHMSEEQDQFVSERLADVRPSPEDECVRSDMHGFLTQFLSELSPSLRKAVQLRDVDGMTTSEAARILGVPDGTVKSWVSRGRSKLKRLMSAR